MIGLREFLRVHSGEELNRSAEEYFARITDWPYPLAKPFGAPEDCVRQTHFAFSSYQEITVIE
jgi:hypothetical protein